MRTVVASMVDIITQVDDQHSPVISKSLVDLFEPYSIDIAGWVFNESVVGSMVDIRTQTDDQHSLAFLPIVDLFEPYSRHCSW